jgi:hypothetical protein
MKNFNKDMISLCMRFEAWNGRKPYVILGKKTAVEEVGLSEEDINKLKVFVSNLDYDYLKSIFEKEENKSFGYGIAIGSFDYGFVLV